MNKVYMGVGVAVLVAVAGVYFVLCQPTAEPVSIKPVYTATSSTTMTAITTEEGESNDIELDLSKLQGKDRLYTEEEGKYENLSEEERRMVVRASCGLNSAYSQHVGTYLDCAKYMSYFINQSRLISLKNGIAAIYGPSESEAIGSVLFYNIATDKIIHHIPDAHNFAFDSYYIVYLAPVLNNESKQQTTWVLKYYRPGMSDFVEIPNSGMNLNTGESHINNLIRLSSVDFDRDIMTAHVYFLGCDGSETGYPLNCIKTHEEVKTSDFSNLP